MSARSIIEAAFAPAQLPLHRARVFFERDIGEFVAQMQVERGFSPHTASAYKRDWKR